jgi:hypothetical protein
MTKRIRYAMRCVINMGNYENIQIEYEEAIDVDSDYVVNRDKLIDRVTKVVEEEVLEVRKNNDK